MFENKSIQTQIIEAIEKIYNKGRGEEHNDLKECFRSKKIEYEEGEEMDKETCFEQVDKDKEIENMCSVKKMGRHEMNEIKKIKQFENDDVRCQLTKFLLYFEFSQIKSLRELLLSEERVWGIPPKNQFIHKKLLDLIAELKEGMGNKNIIEYLEYLNEMIPDDEKFIVNDILKKLYSFEVNKWEEAIEEIKSGIESIESIEPNMSPEEKEREEYWEKKSKEMKEKVKERQTRRNQINYNYRNYKKID